MAATKKKKRNVTLALTRKGRVRKRVSKALKKYVKAAGAKQNAPRVREVHFKGNKPREFRGFDVIRIEPQKNGTIRVIGRRSRKK